MSCVCIPKGPYPKRSSADEGIVETADREADFYQSRYRLPAARLRRSRWLFPGAASAPPTLRRRRSRTGRLRHLCEGVDRPTDRRAYRCRWTVNGDARRVQQARHRMGRIPGGQGLQCRHEHADPRSEEHTSELQSLMRISYAVFCLKKKKKNTNTLAIQD